MLALRPRAILPLYDWAIEHVRVPSGPHAGARLTASAQPVSDLILREMSRTDRRAVCLVAPAQSGKSLIGWLVPLLYWAIERGAPVGMGVPTRYLAAERWDSMIRPALEASPTLARHLPRSGRGGLHYTGMGRVELTQAGTLHVLSGTARDKSRAAITCRALCCTETDGYGEIRPTSPEADPISQMRARLLAYGTQAREYYECTVSTEVGWIWHAYQASSRGRVEHRCPMCRAFVTLDREHLRGWQEAATEAEAEASAYYACPACGARWSERERRISLLAGRITHEDPGAATLGIRYTAAQNMLLPAGYVAREEWLAARRPDSEALRRRLAQQMWATPPPPPPDATISIDVSSASTALQRGVIPRDGERVYVGVDVGARRIHWTALCPAGDRAHVLAYGVLQTPDASSDAARVYAGLRRLHSLVASGWIREGDGARVDTAAVFVDSGYEPRAVREACRALGWTPCVGRPTTVYRGPRWSPGKPRPREGDGWHIARLEGVVHDADASKRALHEISRAGRLTLFGQPDEHEMFLRHLSAEVASERRGRVVYEKLGARENHWLDATALALLAWRVSEPVASDPLRQVTQAGEHDEAGDETSEIKQASQPSLTTFSRQRRVRRIVRVNR